MRATGRWLLAMAAVLLCLVLQGLPCAVSRAVAQDPPPTWLKSLDDAAKARTTAPKPTLVYFFNYQARPCKVMQNDTFVSDAVRQRLSEFITVALDTDKNQGTVKSMGIIRVPTVVFLNGQGKEIDRAVGFKTSIDFAKYLDRSRNAWIESGGAGAIKTGGTIAPFQSATLNVLKPSANSKPVTLTYRGPATSVSVVGDFNDWRGNTIPLQKTANGDWQATLHLIDGVYEYMYILGGKEYVQDKLNPRWIPNPYGGSNSVLVIGNPKTSPIIKGKDVTFIVYRPNAKNISVAGTFNNWSSITMYRNPEDPGMWGVKYSLPPGQYSYKYIIDGNWTHDPENYTPVVDEHGNTNSSFVIR